MPKSMETEEGGPSKTQTKEFIHARPPKTQSFLSTRHQFVEGASVPRGQTHAHCPLLCGEEEDGVRLTG